MPRTAIFKEKVGPFYALRVGPSYALSSNPKDTLAEAMGKMARYHVGQLPVVDGSELVGVVSIGDLVKSLNEQVEAENRHLMDYLRGRS